MMRQRNSLSSKRTISSFFQSQLISLSPTTDSYVRLQVSTFLYLKDLISIRCLKKAGLAVGELVSELYEYLWFTGIPYLNSEEEKRYKDGLAERQQLRVKQQANSFSLQNDKSDIINMTDIDKQQVDNILWVYK